MQGPYPSRALSWHPARGLVTSLHFPLMTVASLRTGIDESRRARAARTRSRPDRVWDGGLFCWLCLNATLCDPRWGRVESTSAVSMLKLKYDGGAQ